MEPPLDQVPAEHRAQSGPPLPAEQAAGMSHICVMQARRAAYMSRGHAFGRCLRHSQPQRFTCCAAAHNVAMCFILLLHVVTSVRTRCQLTSASVNAGISPAGQLRKMSKAWRQSLASVRWLQCVRSASVPWHLRDTVMAGRSGMHECAGSHTRQAGGVASTQVSVRRVVRVQRCLCLHACNRARQRPSR